MVWRVLADVVVAVHLAFTLFVVGIVWPVASLARVQVHVVSPVDATVGETVTLRVRPVT